MSNLLRAITELTAQEQTSLEVAIYPAFKEVAFNSIQTKMQTAVKLQALKPPQFTASIKEMAQASHLVDVILKVKEPATFSATEKVALADVHAQYASALYRFRPAETKLSEKTMLKSHELDPNNMVANRLYLDMNYIPPDDAPEPVPETTFFKGKINAIKTNNDPSDKELGQDEKGPTFD